MIDMFIVFNIILLLFGVKLQIWHQSRTTFFIFIVSLAVFLEIKYCYTMETILFTLGFFLLLLFCRAVFRKFLQDSKYRWFA